MGVSDGLWDQMDVFMDAKAGQLSICAMLGANVRVLELVSCHGWPVHEHCTNWWASWAEGGRWRLVGIVQRWIWVNSRRKSKLSAYKAGVGIILATYGERQWRGKGGGGHVLGGNCAGGGQGAHGG